MEIFRSIEKRRIAILVAVIMSVSSFGVIATDYSYAAKKKKVTSVTLTNVGNAFSIKKGESKKLKYRITAKKKYRKVKWKSSNKNIVSVNKRGIITAKKKGTAYITVYSKTKKRIKDRVKITVTVPVTSVLLGGSTIYVKQGEQKRIVSSVKPSDASNKSLGWTSSDNTIASVSSNGVVLGKQKGMVTIRATANDGSGKYGYVTVKVINLSRSDAEFIAHRGYSSNAPENTLVAFEMASRNNFHGAEMDVWESDAYLKETDDPDYMEDCFDLNIMHDSSTGRMCDKDVDIWAVNDLNRHDYPITKGNGIDNYSTQYIPTLEDALSILNETNIETGHETLPVIELKQDSYSNEAIVHMIDLVQDYGGSATFISFKTNPLNQIQEEIDVRVKKGILADGQIQTNYLANSIDQSVVDSCVSNGYSGISISYKAITESIISYAHSQGLIVAAWTIPSMEEAARLIDMGVDRVTSDYKIFTE
ncbi:MAG: hypothetical protein E7221_00550 [Clostridiales bacterium]|nr:hypothetical protein [Clostridiales bacterium]